MRSNTLGSADRKKNRVWVLWCCLWPQKNVCFLNEIPYYSSKYCEMRSPANRRRSSRNRRNRQQPTNERTTLKYQPKLKYSTSCVNEDGVFMLTKRKRVLPTPEEVEEKKMRKLQVQQRKYFTLSLRHKVVNMWLHGVNCNDWNFAARNTRKVIEFLQTTYPKYAEFAAAKSFVYRVIGRFRDTDPMPSDDPFIPRTARREQTENKTQNARIVDGFLIWVLRNCSLWFPSYVERDLKIFK